MEISWLELARIVPEIAVALLFAWFIRSERDANQKSSSSIMTDWANRMKERDTMWRDFLAEQRTQTNESIGRLAEEIKEIGKGISANTALLTQHDRQAHDFIVAQSERRKGGAQ